MTEKKYELTKEVLKIDINTTTGKSRELYRIKALKDFKDVKKGDLGGYVETEFNLSQEGDCWIYDNAKVYNNSFVLENAEIRNNAILMDNTKAFNSTIIKNNAIVYGGSTVMNNAVVKDDACVNCSSIKNNAQVLDRALITNNSVIRDNGKVCGTANIFGAGVYDNAIINGGTVSNFAEISGNAVINKSSDYVVIKGLGLSETITFFITKDKSICTSYGFTLEQFKENIGNTKNEKTLKHELSLLIDLVKYHFSHED